MALTDEQLAEYMVGFEALNSVGVALDEAGQEMRSLVAELIQRRAADRALATMVADLRERLEAMRPPS